MGRGAICLKLSLSLFILIVLNNTIAQSSDSIKEQSVCPSNYELRNGLCYYIGNRCPEDYHLHTDGLCYPIEQLFMSADMETPKQCPPNYEFHNTLCYYNKNGCPDGYNSRKDGCYPSVAMCPTNYKLKNGLCYYMGNRCPENYYLHTDGICYPVERPDEIENMKMTKQCPSNFEFHKGFCYYNKNGCPEGYYHRKNGCFPRT